MGVCTAGVFCLILQRETKRIQTVCLDGACHVCELYVHEHRLYALSPRHRRPYGHTLAPLRTVVVAHPLGTVARPDCRL